MNLRRILQGLAVCLFVVFYSNNIQAQVAQLAAVNQDGLIQLGSNHPFVVDEYQIDLKGLNISTPAQAAAFFEPYMQGFTFQFELADQKAYMTIPRHLIADGDIAVAHMNNQLRAIHRLHN